MKVKTEKGLIYKWRREAARLSSVSQKTWKGLRTGRLPQEDRIIYSAYENQATANALLNCARELENLVKYGGVK